MACAYLYVLVFLNVATRKVFVTKATEHPNTQWVTERAAEFVRHARDNKLAVDLVFHDADRKFSKAFGESLRKRGVRPASCVLVHRISMPTWSAGFSRSRSSAWTILWCWARRI